MRGPFRNHLPIRYHGLVGRITVAQGGVGWIMDLQRGSNRRKKPFARRVICVVIWCLRKLLKSRGPMDKGGELAVAAKETRKVSPEEREILLAEYSAAQEDYFHNDTYPWMVGSVLMAGAFVFWGAILDKEVKAPEFACCAILLTMLMSVWLLYSDRCRQTYMCKLHRMWEIEACLGMQLHSRWIAPDPPECHSHGLVKGHLLNLGVFWLVTVGTCMLGWLKNAGSPWLSIALVWAVLVNLEVLKNQRRAKAHWSRYLGRIGGTGSKHTGCSVQPCAERGVPEKEGVPREKLGDP